MTILQTTTVVTPIPILAIIAILCFIFAVAAAFSSVDVETSGKIIIISFALGIISGILSIIMAKETTRYQVLLDDTYPVSELYENYEIVEQEGVTYWVEEKDNEN